MAHVDSYSVRDIPGTICQEALLARNREAKPLFYNWKRQYGIPQVVHLDVRWEQYLEEETRSVFANEIGQSRLYQSAMTETL